MDVVLVQGAAKTCVSVSENLTIRELMQIVEENTKIPVYSQKLIFKGINIVNKEPEAKLCDLGVKNKSKIMVIGQRHDPQETEILKKLKEIDKSIDKMVKHYDDIISDIDGMKKGYLEESFHSEFLEKVKKNLLRCTESGMKAIESLDIMSIEQNFKDAREKKKQLIKRIQSLLDECDKTSDQLVSSGSGMN